MVSDQRDNRLVGILTDRDLALKIIAEGRDPHTTRVDEVMSLNPVCCREDDSTDQALRLMSRIRFGASQSSMRVTVCAVLSPRLT